MYLIDLFVCSEIDSSWNAQWVELDDFHLFAFLYISRLVSIVTITTIGCPAGFVSWANILVFDWLLWIEHTRGWDISCIATIDYCRWFHRSFEFGKVNTIYWLFSGMR